MADVKQQADALVEEGLQLYSSGELDAALAKWRSALELVRDHSRALEYYRYVQSNRSALEESFRLAANQAGDGSDDLDSSELIDEVLDSSKSSSVSGIIFSGESLELYPEESGDQSVEEAILRFLESGQFPKSDETDGRYYTGKESGVTSQESE